MSPGSTCSFFCGNKGKVILLAGKKLLPDNYFGHYVLLKSVMKAEGKFILLEAEEFKPWLKKLSVTRKIKLIQHHHTWSPDYSLFSNENHFNLCRSMEDAHLQRGFSEIAQNFTTFPDGKIMVCRSINKIPAGIKGANTYGICIENIGNFDSGYDIMDPRQKDVIIKMTKTLLVIFSLTSTDKTVVYHHWYDLTLGTRIKKEGTGDTKTCPGTTFFGGNTVIDFRKNLLPLLLQK